MNNYKAMIEVCGYTGKDSRIIGAYFPTIEQAQAWLFRHSINLINRRHNTTGANRGLYLDLKGPNGEAWEKYFPIC